MLLLFGWHIFVGLRVYQDLSLCHHAWRQFSESLNMGYIWSDTFRSWILETCWFSINNIPPIFIWQSTNIDVDLWKQKILQQLLLSSMQKPTKPNCTQCNPLISWTWYTKKGIFSSYTVLPIIPENNIAYWRKEAILPTSLKKIYR